MSQEDKARRHRIVLTEVRAKLRKTRSRLLELEAVERYHAREMKASFPPEMPKHQACEAVLKETGRWMKVGEITDYLRNNGYGMNHSRRVLSNMLYTAVNRRTDLFVKRGRKYGLAQWAAAEQTAQS